MAKASSATAGKVADYGVATDRSSQLDGYTVNFVTITKTHDLGLRRPTFSGQWNPVGLSGMESGCASATQEVLARV